ncbi:MAG: DNA adenine methylase, partial [Dehalococcoidia bacterium]
MASLPSKPRLFCEPFCGGGIVGLSALFDGLVDRLVLVELDENVAAVWETVLNGQGEELIERIGRFQVTHESVTRVFARPSRTQLDRAFA